MRTLVSGMSFLAHIIIVNHVLCKWMSNVMASWAVTFESALPQGVVYTNTVESTLGAVNYVNVFCFCLKKKHSYIFSLRFRY